MYIILFHDSLWFLDVLGLLHLCLLDWNSTKVEGAGGPTCALRASFFSCKPQVLAGEHEEALQVLGEARSQRVDAEIHLVLRPPCAFGRATSRLPWPRCGGLCLLTLKTISKAMAVRLIAAVGVHLDVGRLCGSIESLP